MSHRVHAATVLVTVALASVALTPCVASQTSTDEQGVRGALALFKSGIDTGSKSLGSQIATGPFKSQIIALYDLLIDSYAKSGIPMPLEVGRVRILENGQAKVQTYLNPARDLIVFTLTRVDGTWKFSHMEGILIPLFDFPDLPYVRIHQLPPDRRGFMLAERDLAFRSYVYHEVKKDRGEQGARDFFLDGPGFKAAMDAWLPFLEGAGRFALFLSILESNYYGSTCVVTQATEAEAEVRFGPLRDLEVLKTAVFSPKLTSTEFESLYRHIMQDRAETCGLTVDISIQDVNCLLKVRKK